MVIGGDAEHFSAGANLGLIQEASKKQNWDAISAIIKRGQKAMLGLKYAPFPVVAAPSGMALGGGCELLLHSSAIQAHVETYAGLVEAGVGLVPAWGGCTQMLMRHLGAHQHGKPPEGQLATANTIGDIKKVFDLIAYGKVAGSAQEARDMKILRENDGISMNRDRVLADAKERCMEMAVDYQPPEPARVYIPGGPAKIALAGMIGGGKIFSNAKEVLHAVGLSRGGQMSNHDVVVSKALANVLSAGGGKSPPGAMIGRPLSEDDLMKLEHDTFMELVKTPGTQARIDHMLATGKPLREMTEYHNSKKAAGSGRGA
jgi:3-hydroxyacyl-CoA dehydrogenase